MNWFEGKKIVVPIDFSEQSHQAVDEALEMVFRSEDVYVVHVAEPLAVMAPEAIWQDVSDEKRQEQIENHVRKEFADNKYRHITFHSSIGNPGNAIAQYADEVGADVIVMPSHGRTGLKRLLLGSVAERVLRLARCPVLILKH